MPSQPFRDSWLAGLTVRHSLPAPTANDHDAVACEEREASAGWHKIFAQVLKQKSVHTDSRIRACRKYELPELAMLVLAKENAACPEMYEQNGGLNAATAEGLR